MTGTIPSQLAHLASLEELHLVASSPTHLNAFHGTWAHLRSASKTVLQLPRILPSVSFYFPNTSMPFAVRRRACVLRQMLRVLCQNVLRVLCQNVLQLLHISLFVSLIFNAFHGGFNAFHGGVKCTRTCVLLQDVLRLPHILTFFSLTYSPFFFIPLKGSIPSQLGYLTSLTALTLSYGQSLRGAIPKALALLTRITDQNFNVGRLNSIHAHFSVFMLIPLFSVTPFRIAHVHHGSELQRR
jgi:hypothetical protein